MLKISSTEVLEWARLFLEKAVEELSQEEVKEQKKYASLVQDENSKIFLTKMLDESSQIRDNKKLNKLVRQNIKKYGIPDFMSLPDRLLLKLYMCGGFLFPSIAMPAFKKKLRKETSKVIIAEERPELTKHLKKRVAKKIGQNVNILGEVVLGDGEAEHRYQHYLAALKEKDINYISVKISGIYAQIKPLSYEQNKREICELMANIYRQAIVHPYVDKQGNKQAKFVNLDMEEYKDAELTMDVFIDVLSRAEFKNYSAGIVIQAYLPDAEALQGRLLDFAKKRVAAGGAAIKMRLVKGANLQMESIVSSLKGWANPVYPSKIEVDANYLHILDIALQPENTAVCSVGVASHNFFTIGYAYLLAEKNNVIDSVSFEMLEGMANNLPRVMLKLKRNIILYTPVVKAKHFLNAVSYLVRRLDENTGKENFLAYSFNLQYESAEWNLLADQFLKAYALKDSIRTTPFRTQNRNLPQPALKDIKTFHNEADTDLDLPQNREWALAVLDKWSKLSPKDLSVPVQIGERTKETKAKKKYYDRSRNDEFLFCEASLASLDDIKEIIELADKDESNWRKTTTKARNKVLHRVAENIAAKRGDLIGCMSAITGKTFMEGDVEVSEAIDFCRYYPLTMLDFEELESVKYKAKGVILVIPPWNFPLAIPVGGVAAALAAGNSVLLKPATLALPVAWEFAQCFWDAGVPKDALQVLCPAERESLNYLTAHPVVKHIVLTGGTDTALRLLKNSPRTALSAETGGKNSIILSEHGDQDHAILNIVSSAFGNAGQKCSACSLLLLNKAAFHDKFFKLKLIDAVKSLRTGSVWDTANLIGPMIDNNNEKLLHAINNLEEGESWLVAPEFVDEKKYILKPTVKWGVKPDSFSFKNELFAPLLSVVCIDDLQHGIDLTNSSEYGLTAGLQSINEEERELWKNSIEAGNLYINRGVTGAIVRRQPFGGMKRSAFGEGIKAGGPNYVSLFVEFREKKSITASSDSPLSEFVEDKSDKLRLNYADDSYKRAWEDVFSKEKDISKIRGEENIFRYLALKSCVLFVQEGDCLADILLIIQAAQMAKTPLTISIDKGNSALTTLKEALKLLGSLKLKEQDEASFIDEMELYDRIRACTPNLSDAFYEKAAMLGKHISHQKALAEGRIELLHYLKEQSISFEYHRYGSVLEKNENWNV